MKGLTALTVKKVIFSICAVLLAVIVAAVSYILYVVFSYYRLEDNLQLEISGESKTTVPVGEKLTLVTYNIGFGAYSDDYSFFMDGGEYSRAFSKQAVIDNTNGSLNAVQAQQPDFVILQEVDISGTRSYDVDQTAVFSSGFDGYDSVFAQNYDSPYFIYPFTQPIGANKSGLMTFSKHNIESSVRRSLPIEGSFNKYIDLDRAYTVSVIPAANGKSLILYNVHLSAYTSDGKIAEEQLKMLSDDMKAQYNKGNYIVAAGDFNKDMLGDSSKYFKRSEGDFNWAKPFDTTLLPSEITAYSGTNVPTCRNADSAFRNDGTVLVISVDGVLVSNNIEVVVCETVDTGFKFSDHNPVKCEFILK